MVTSQNSDLNVSPSSAGVLDSLATSQNSDLNVSLSDAGVLDSLVTSQNSRLNVSPTGAGVLDSLITSRVLQHGDVEVSQTSCGLGVSLSDSELFDCLVWESWEDEEYSVKF